MKRFVLAAALLGGFIALSATEAGAFVCARGVYRAGCVGRWRRGGRASWLRRRCLSWRRLPWRRLSSVLTTALTASCKGALT
jgi:hypothetical protein